MRIVNNPVYRCETCNRSFTDARSALDHEAECRREAFVRDRLLGSWVSDGLGVTGIACLSRVHDARVGVMDPLTAGVSWMVPSALEVIGESEARKVLESRVRANIDEAMSRAGRDADAGHRVPPQQDHKGIRHPRLRNLLRPCGSIEEAVREGARLAENRLDFEDNFTVVYWFEGKYRGFLPVPSELVEAVKQEVLG